MNTTFPLQDSDLFRLQAFVSGRWSDADSGATPEVNNPATVEILGTVPKMGANETWRAIEAAKDAFIDWSRKPAKERSVLMRLENWRRRCRRVAADLQKNALTPHVSFALL